MLIIAGNMSQLPFSQLKKVYEQSIMQSAQRDYPGRSDGILQAEMDLYDYFRSVFFNTPGACVCMWEEAGVILSVLRLEPFQDGLLVTGLETAPDCRGRGYAGRLLAAALETAAAKCPVYAHIHRANRASAAVHKKCGFEKIANYSTFLDGSTSSFYDTYRRYVVQN